jgi:hypothetical protein
MRRVLILLALLVLAACRPPEKPKIPTEPPPPKPSAALEAKPGPGVLIVCAPIPSADYGDCCVRHGGNAGVAAHGPVMCRDGEASKTCRCE